MGGTYIVSIDQSTQGTKALLFDAAGNLIHRSDLPHRQIINDRGWISHDAEEIYGNVVQSFRNLIGESGIDRDDVAAVGISNQRETTVLWDRQTGKALEYAVVWQCGRAEPICSRLSAQGYGETVLRKTGIPISCFFPAAKMAWLLRQDPSYMERAEKGQICLGTIDSWVLFRLTGGVSFKTDYSNASRTQLFNIHTLAWDEELCRIFGIPAGALAEVCDSDACFGYTDFDGFLRKRIPVTAMLGDSHAALFGQGCVRPGMVKTTYGTGSSLMMNIGETLIESQHGLTASLAWSTGGRAVYCLEGNLICTGAVISWLKNDLRMIDSPAETEGLARRANPKDSTYLVPAFSGLGAPYWDANAAAAFTGMTRTTRREELVKAALESIAYQIADVVFAMEQDTGAALSGLRVDGGASKNGYLMQFQADILDKTVSVSASEEASGIGAACLAGISAGVYEMEELSANRRFTDYQPSMPADVRENRYAGWKEAVGRVLTRQ